MSQILITVGELKFVAELQFQLAPKTCEAFLKILPFHQKIIQARWSGEAGWIPLGDFNINVGPENSISQPEPGMLLFHPQSISETEILLPYGQTSFASKFGELKGNPFLKLIEGRDQLQKLGENLLWQGAQSISFEMMPKES